MRGRGEDRDWLRERFADLIVSVGCYLGVKPRPTVDKVMGRKPKYDNEALAMALAGGDKPKSTNVVKSGRPRTKKEAEAAAPAWHKERDEFKAMMRERAQAIKKGKAGGE